MIAVATTVGLWVVLSPVPFGAAQKNFGGNIALAYGSVETFASLRCIPAQGATTTPEQRANCEKAIVEKNAKTANNIFSWAWDKTFGNMFNLAFGVIGKIFFLAAYFISFIAGIIVSLQAWLLGIVLELNTDIVNGPVVQLGYKMSSALFNVFSLIALVMIAIATIVRYTPYGAKALLPKFLAAILLVNFGLPLTGQIIKFNDTLASYFINQISPAGGNSFHNFAMALSGSFQPQKANLTSLSDEQMGTTNATAVGAELNDSGGGSAVAGLLQSTGSLVFSILGSLLIIVILATINCLFLIRYVALGILLVLFPLAMIGFILPMFRSQWGEWWSKFLKYSFFAPLCVFFLWLGIKVIEALATTNIWAPAGAAAGLAGALGALATTASFFLQMIVSLAIIAAGIFAAQKVGVYGSQGAVAAVQGARRGVQSWAKKGVADKGKEYWGKATAQAARVKQRLTTLPAVTAVQTAARGGTKTEAAMAAQKARVEAVPAAGPKPEDQPPPAAAAAQPSSPPPPSASPAGAAARPKVIPIAPAQPVRIAAESLPQLQPAAHAPASQPQVMGTAPVGLGGETSASPFQRGFAEGVPAGTPPAVAEPEEAAISPEIQEAMKGARAAKSALEAAAAKRDRIRGEKSIGFGGAEQKAGRLQRAEAEVARVQATLAAAEARLLREKAEVKQRQEQRAADALAAARLAKTREELAAVSGRGRAVAVGSGLGRVAYLGSHPVEAHRAARDRVAGWTEGWYNSESKSKQRAARLTAGVAGVAAGAAAAGGVLAKGAARTAWGLTKGIVGAAVTGALSYQQYSTTPKIWRCQKCPQETYSPKRPVYCANRSCEFGRARAPRPNQAEFAAWKERRKDNFYTTGTLSPQELAATA
ncbi:MAG: hypothetical protein HY978_01430 [Candidatus Liptonbacteria bacterium]|nr:hypothetical protein [Candidatus Liptonbacteria bacterium]